MEGSSEEFFSSEIFAALLSGDVVKLWKSPRNHVCPFLPYLVYASSSSQPQSFQYQTTWSKSRRLLLALLAELDQVNSIKRYLELDFSELKQDALKERQLLEKLHPGETRPGDGSLLASSIQRGLVTEFELSSWMRRCRLVLSELLRIMHQVLVDAAKVLYLLTCNLHCT